jgi:hypothetical protein
LLTQPFVEVAAGAATGNDFVAHFVQPMANSGAYAAHATCHVSDFLTHNFLSPVIGFL